MSHHTSQRYMNLYYAGFGLYLFAALVTVACLLRQFVYSRRWTSRIGFHLLLLVFCLLSVGHFLALVLKGAPRTDKAAGVSRSAYMFYVLAQSALFGCLTLAIDTWSAVFYISERRWKFVVAANVLVLGTCLAATAACWRSADVQQFIGKSSFFFVCQWVVVVSLVVSAMGFLGFLWRTTRRLRHYPPFARRRLRGIVRSLTVTMTGCSLCFLLRVGALIAAYAVNQQTAWARDPVTNDLLWFIASDWAPLLPPLFCLLYLMRIPEAPRLGKGGGSAGSPGKLSGGAPGSRSPGSNGSTGLPNGDGPDGDYGSFGGRRHGDFVDADVRGDGGLDESLLPPPGGLAYGDELEDALSGDPSGGYGYVDTRAYTNDLGNGHGHGNGNVGGYASRQRGHAQNHSAQSQDDYMWHDPARRDSAYDFSIYRPAFHSHGLDFHSRAALLCKFMTGLQPRPKRRGRAGGRDGHADWRVRHTARLGTGRRARDRPRQRDLKQQTHGGRF